MEINSSANNKERQQNVKAESQKYCNPHTKNALSVSLLLDVIKPLFILVDAVG